MIGFGSLRSGNNNTNSVSSPSSGARPTVALTSPRENVTAVFQLSQIVILRVPYGTPRSGAIRAFIAARLLNENNQRLFIFRRDTGNSWTTIALDATPSEPKLTAPPAEIARKLTTILTTCADVGTVTLFDESNNVLTAE